MAPPKKLTKYQNISTVQTSVQRDKGGGEAYSFALPPRAIVQLTEADVELTKDRCSPRDRNPFDMGLVKAIPSNMSVHPEVTDEPTRFDAQRVQTAMVDGTLAEVEEMLANAQDMGHMVMFDRSLMSVSKNMPEAKVNDLEQAMSDRRTAIASEAKRRGQTLDNQIRG